ncbi:hypothetical protein CC99x_006110 [Candidatus Berkiella cookevillensis]|uniref:Uncharacterized protein n=1 Tax=Candidatus Berkiella cookevillensis TaxID=437022 RepID=A0A0Q9YTG5_9GAMM|nr:hypothetical protein [Candidatus Berkiella cookevillensis]MCS5708479.1 hypothetical protein [Candidatus Berkiella cookevillensis]
MLQSHHPLSAAIEHLKSFQKYGEFKALVVYLLQHIHPNLTADAFNERIEEIKPSAQRTWLDKNLGSAFIRAAEDVARCLSVYREGFLASESENKAIVPSYKNNQAKLRLNSSSETTPLLAESSTEDYALLGDSKKNKKRSSDLF